MYVCHGVNTNRTNMLILCYLALAEWEKTRFLFEIIKYNWFIRMKSKITVVIRIYYEQSDLIKPIGVFIYVIKYNDYPSPMK